MEKYSGVWGGGVAGAIWAFILAKYLALPVNLFGVGLSCASSGVRTQDSNELTTFMCRAFLDPRATFLEKYLSIAIGAVLLGLAVGAVYNWIAEKNDWHTHEPPARFGLGMLSAALAFCAIYASQSSTGFEAFLRYAVSFRWL